MPESRHKRDFKKCLYAHDLGVIQLDVERSGMIFKNQTKKYTSWTALTDHFTDNQEKGPQSSQALMELNIHCALHPALSSKDLSSSIFNRVRMKYINGVEIVSARKQFRAKSAIVFCDIPPLYLTPEANPDGNSSPVKHDVSWGTYDVMMTILQTHFRYCLKIMLVLGTDLDIRLLRRPETQEERDALLARLEKVLSRADEVYRALTQQGCDFSIFPSPAAFEICLDEAKRAGGVFEEGDFDCNRGAESRVWRSVDAHSGFWMRTSFFDSFARGYVQFV